MNLLQQHPDNAAIIRKVRLSRAAADGSLDEARFSVTTEKSGQINKGDYEPFSMLKGEGEEFAPKFEAETNQSYLASLQFLTSPGYTQHVLDTYLTIFSKTARELTVDSNNDQLLQVAESAQKMAMHYARELMIADKVFLFTDAANGLPYSWIVSRENITNYAYDADGLAFVTYCTHETKIDGFSADYEKFLYGFSRADFIKAKIDGNNSQIVESVENPFNPYMPVHEFHLNDGNGPLLSIAKIDHDIMNLQREMRKLIRDLGFNILVMEDDNQRKKLELGAQAVLRIPAGAGTQPYVLNMAAGSIDAHLAYYDRMLEMQDTLSKLRRQKSTAETATAKRLDFVQVEGVLNRLADVVEKIVETSIVDSARYLDLSEIAVDYKINREFDTEEVETAIDTLTNIKLAGLPKVLETKAVLQFAKKHLGATEEELEEAASEMLVESDLGVLQDED